jgi:uncharacterized protein Yka (UPF0111/DUF47 family)
MKAIFLPKREKIYTLFCSATKEIVKAANEFNLLLTDLSNAEHHSQLIGSYEKEGDKVANATFEYLHKTFITPFDHYDIQQIIIHLDDILDVLNRMVQRIAIYQLDTLPVEITSLGSLCIRLSELADNSVSLLSSLKNTKKILAYCDEITKFKSEAQRRLTNGIANLFKNENDIKKLIKIKDIFESSKLLVDKYEDFANVIKSIILEYS